MYRVLRTAAAVLTGVVLVAACQDDGEPRQAGSSSIEAFPDVPHFRGHLAVLLRPALEIVSDSACQPAPDRNVFCSVGDGEAFRALGEARLTAVVEVRTAPSEDHTAWDTVVRFDPDDRQAVRGAAEQARGLGGVVLLMAANRVVRAIDPPDLGAQRARLLGLEKPEAWAFVESFNGV